MFGHGPLVEHRRPALARQAAEEHIANRRPPKDRRRPMGSKGSTAEGAISSLLPRTGASAFPRGRPRPSTRHPSSPTSHFFHNVGPRMSRQLLWGSFCSP